MKRNKRVILSLGVWLLMILTGCGCQIPDMSESQRAAISEYAVELLLKYNATQPSRLVDLDELEKQEVSKPHKPIATLPPKQNTGMDETENTPIIGEEESVSKECEVELALGLEPGVSLEFMGCQIQESYKDSGVETLVIEAGTGKKLLVCEFALINDNATNQSVDMLKESIKYWVAADQLNTNCLVTMLSNDLTTYMGILAPDESRKVIVLAEIEEQEFLEANEVLMIVERGELQTSIKIK